MAGKLIRFIQQSIQPCPFASHYIDDLRFCKDDIAIKVDGLGE